MIELKSNPFKFGNPVEGDYYLPRRQLTQAVKQFLQNQIHVVLIGPRHFGKTSFVLNALKELENDGYYGQYRNKKIHPPSMKKFRQNPSLSPVALKEVIIIKSWLKLKGIISTKLSYDEQIGKIESAVQFRNWM